MLSLGLLLAAPPVHAGALGTSFAYQGQLRAGSYPANGQYDFKFALYDAATNGNRLGSFMTNCSVSVSAGLFSATVDFGAVFDGTPSWLEIGVRTNGAAEDFTTLIPRQPLQPAPQALYSETAGTADSVPASNISGTIPASNLPPNVALLDARPAFSAPVSAPSFIGAFAGDGSGLTNLILPAASITGVISPSRLPPSVAFLDGDPAFSAPVRAPSFIGAFAGDGSGLTNLLLPAANLVGALSDTRLSANVALLNRTNLFTGPNIFGGPTLLTNPDNVIYGSFSGTVPAASITGVISSFNLPPNVALLNARPTFSYPVFAPSFIGAFAGDGSGLTNLILPAASITGVIPSSSLPANVALLDADPTFSAPVSAPSFSGAFVGDGSALTNLRLPAANLVGALSDTQLSANVALLNRTNLFSGSNIFAGPTLLTNPDNVIHGSFSGTLPAASLTGVIPSSSLPANVALLDADPTFSAPVIAPSFSGAFVGDGSALTNLRLPAANLVGALSDTQLSANVALLNRTNLFTGSNIFAGPTLLTNPDNVIHGSFSGTLPAASLTGVISSLNLPPNVALLDGDPAFSAPVSAPSFSGAFVGDGSALTNLRLPTANLVGALSDTQLSANVALLNRTNLFSGSNIFAGPTLLTNPDNVIHGSFSGTVPAASLTGVIPSSSLPANVALLDADPTFSAPVIAPSFVGAFAGDGSGLTNLSLPSANLVGALSDTQLPANVALLNRTNLFTGSNIFAGPTLLTNPDNIIYGSFSGTVPAASLTGVIPSSSVPANVALLDADPTFSAPVIAPSFVGAFVGDGSGLSNIDADFVNNGVSNLMVLMPDQNVFTNSLYVGNGGRNSTLSPPNPIDPLPFEQDGSYNGTLNTFVGISAGFNNASGNFNTFLGSLAGINNTIGDQDTFLGALAGLSNVGGYHDTYVGVGAGQANATGYFNVFVGCDSGLVSSGGCDNTVVGASAATYLSGSGNAIFGAGAVSANTASGSNNALIGTQCGEYSTSGSYNAAVGHQSLFYNSSGAYNAALGAGALQGNTSGQLNVGLGASTLALNQTGGANTACGHEALFNCTGSGNQALGYRAGLTLAGGSCNTFLGYQADAAPASASSLVYATAIGAGATVTNSHNIVVGTSAERTIVPGQLVVYAYATLSGAGAPPQAINFPSSGVNWTNATGTNIVLYIDNSGAMASALSKNGYQIFSTPGQNVTLLFKPGDYFNETYAGESPAAAWEVR
ncbi:MAG: beta strand repeat-containing protein [Limisphaerales bacterium]